MMIFVLFPYLSKISIYLFFSKGKVLCTLPAGNLVTHRVPPPPSPPCHWEPEETCLLERGYLTPSSNYCLTL